MTRNEMFVQIMSEVDDEFVRAVKKHPDWPTDVIHASSIVAEEAGELSRAVNQYIYEESSTLEDVRKEAIQTAAMAIRFLLSTDQYARRIPPLHQRDKELLNANTTASQQQGLPADSKEQDTRAG